MTKLLLDLTDPDVASACGDHKVGESLTLTVAGDVTEKTDKQLTVEVSDVEYNEGSPAEEAGDTGEGADEATPKKSKKPTAPVAY